MTDETRTTPDGTDPGDVQPDATAATPAADDGSEPASRRALPGRLVWVVWAAVAAAILVCDQATKGIAVAELSARVIDLGLMDLRLVRNPNAAFGIPGFSGMFPIVAVVVVIMIVRALPDTDRLSSAAGYGLLTGGALGNAIDRVARYPGLPNGYVVDFFDLRWFPVFNIADSAIVCGALALGVLLMRAEREERRLANAPRRPSVRPDTSTPRR
ncbi:MAG TPA: signal peptidase II [Euzebyales bacterium]|nr:signal peptidase II [Euzebyales bacterium]